MPFEWFYVGTYRQWIGKPDPSGFGRYEVRSKDPSWLHEYMLKAKSRGDRVGVMCKRLVNPSKGVGK